MDGILQLVGALISFTARVLVLILATPFVLLWPRPDKNVSYGNTVWSRCKHILATVMT